MTKAVVTRFAPSPTGYLHIGGARTALFNWLYARHTGGKMLLRIEDTDRERSTEAATAAILEGLDWLGLGWDGEPYSQAARADRHAEVAHALVKAGKAYYCYCSQAELTEMREKAKAEGRPPRYDGTWRDRDASQAPEGIAPVVRIKAPLSGETLVADKVQGDVRFPNKDLDDLVLLRSDGTPTYMLAVVVDDHDMGVTHIIRGDDHLYLARVFLFQQIIELGRHDALFVVGRNDGADLRRGSVLPFAAFENPLGRTQHPRITHIGIENAQAGGDHRRQGQRHQNDRHACVSILRSLGDFPRLSKSANPSRIVVYIK